MIYTRNKEGFKTKTVKTIMGQGSSSSKPHTLSENGLNLVEELRQRLENKNKKIEIGTEIEISSKSKQTENRPKSNTPKKLTISKNFNQQNVRADNEKSIPLNELKGITVPLKTTEVKENHFQSTSNSNPFSKIKKDSFFQLINHSHQSNQSSISQSNHFSNSQQNQQQTEPLSEIYASEEFQRQSIPRNNNRKNQAYDSWKTEEENETKEMSYESPIQGLNKSNYSNPEQQKEINLMNNSKKMYEDQVKKWKNRANQNSESFSNMANGNSQESQPQLNQRPSQIKTPTLCLISKTLNDTIICCKPSSKSSFISSAQQQYVQLLETQICTLKHELSKCNQKISQLTFSEEKVLRENEILSKDNTNLIRRLEMSEKKLSIDGEQQFVVEKYERFFDKMRNLLIVNAMELIQTKNFIQLQFIPSMPNSLASSPQVTQKHRNTQKPNYPILQPLDCQQRIQSINQCLAKVEQTIEVSQRVVSMNHQRKDKENEAERMTFGKQVQVKELEETLKYKDKIINKLKEEISELKDQHKPANLKQSRQSSNHTQFNKPYSYVDQIHLLRHQITRLTQQNCAFYEKYTHIKAELGSMKDPNKIKNFPNQQQIIEIQTLINKLDKHNLDQLNNSKLEYWTNAKPSTHKKQPSPQTRKTETIKSKSKPKVVMTLLEKPKALDFTAKSSFGNSDTELLPGQEKIIRSSHEKYSSESKNQKIEYSKEEFSQLVKEFKSSLSGLTPQKRPQGKQRKPQINNFGRQEITKQNQNGETIELPTFRTPKQNRDNQKQSNEYSLNHPTQFLSQQQEEPNQTGYLEAISRLEYEKEFLASERENLLKENEKLIERIKELEGQHKDHDRLSIMKEEIYKLKFQNQQLVDRVVEAENLLASQNKSQKSSQLKPLSSHPNSDISQSLQSKQLQIQNLMKQNIQLYKTVQSLQAKHQHLIKTLQSSKQDPSQTQLQDHMSYMLAPSFESLIDFLKKLPQEKQEYHQILLKMIEGYERKVSQFREDNVWIKTKHKEVEEIVAKCGEVLQRVAKYLASQKIVNSDPSAQFLTKLQQQVQKTLSLISQLTLNYFSQSLSPFTSPHSSHPSLIISLQSKINYYLMLLRSFIQGIGESDLQLIESELSDYLKQLKCRIPTVLERDEFQESCLSSLNASVVQDDDEGYQVQD